MIMCRIGQDDYYTTMGLRHFPMIRTRVLVEIKSDLISLSEKEPDWSLTEIFLT